MDLPHPLLIHPYTGQGRPPPEEQTMKIPKIYGRAYAAAAAAGYAPMTCTKLARAAQAQGFAFESITPRADGNYLFWVSQPERGIDFRVIVDANGDILRPARTA
jgi:hypothetical protein